MWAMTNSSDIPSDGWVSRLPAWLVPYARLMRLDRPVGTWLLLLPCWWGIALGGDPWPDLRFLMLFAIGAVIMRGAGCVVNDLWDRELDRRVARTASRPLASGEVTVPAGLLFLAGLLMLGLLVLLQLNLFVIILGVASLGLVIAYPLMKRITWWPQAFLGLTFNWGILMGHAAVAAGLPKEVWVLYAGAVMWTLGYDTIYAHQDKVDDALVGAKSLAIRLGEESRRWIGFFYAGAVVLTGVSGWLAGLGWGFYLGLLAVAAQAVFQLRGWDMNDAADCLKRFRSNRDFGLLVFIALVAGRLTA